MKFTRRTFLGAAGATAVAGCGPRSQPDPWGSVSTLGSTSSAGPRPPNIVYLFADQHRGNVMGAMGDPAAHTPAMDALATESVRFSRCYTNAPLCRPARMAMMSGFYPHQTGIVHNLVTVDPTMPSHVRRIRDEAGYHTMVIGKVHLYDGEDHTDTYLPTLQTMGFSDAIELLGQDEQTRRKSQYSDWLKETTPTGEASKFQRYVDYHDNYTWFSPPPDAAPWLLSTHDHLDQYCARRAVEWIEGWDSEQPFYLQVNFPGPHKPFNATSEFRELYDVESSPFPAAILQEVVDPSPIVAQYTGIKYEPWDEQTIRKLILTYYATVSLVDDAVDQVLGALAAKGLLENTWVIYHSDHGEMLGDHFLTGKVVFYEGAVHVPLMIRPPGGVAGWESQALVDTLDVTTTILEVAGLGREEGEPGVSQLARVAAGPDAPGAQEGKAEIMGGDLDYWFLRTEDRKIGYDPATGEVVEMFDLEGDPQELVNLRADPAAASTRDELAARLEWYLATYPPVST